MRISIVSAALTLCLAPEVVRAFAPGKLSFTSTKYRSKGSLSAAIDVEENAPRNVQGFDQWAGSCGVQRSEGFQLDSQDGLDWYAKTASDLPAGSPVLAVPANMILTTSGCREELWTLDSEGVKAAVDQLSNLGAATSIPKFYLFLKILLEYERGQESPFLPWLDSLPRLFYNSVSMTEFCYECLPPLVFSLSRVERVKFDNMCKALKKVKILNSRLKDDKFICKWAFNIVHTRSFGSDNEFYIAPMADMINHGTETNVDTSFDEQGNINVYTTRDIPAGSPLLMSYGDPTNPSFFFATYGFLDESSPATFCKIMDIPPTRELVDLGLDFSRMLFYKDTGEISQEVWDVMLYAKVLKSDLQTQQQFYQAHMNGDFETKQAIHQAYMGQTAMELKNHVDTFMKQLNDLSQKAEGKSYEEHPRLPLILRHNEFVWNTFQNVKSRLDPMFG